MCGRYVLEIDSDFTERFEVRNKDIVKVKNFNVCPGQEMPVVLLEEGERNMAMMKWGLIPKWVKNPNEFGNKLINARAEGLEKRISFKEALLKRRCLVPVNGFYEWKKEKIKKPYYFSSGSDKYMSLAGLYEIWSDGKGASIKTYTIITTAANETLSEIHDRMPVILEREDERKWLDDNDVFELSRMLKPFSDDKLQGYQVGYEVNLPVNNSENLIKRVET